MYVLPVTIKGNNTAAAIYNAIGALLQEEMCMKRATYIFIPVRHTGYTVCNCKPTRSIFAIHVHVQIYPLKVENFGSANV